MSTSSFRRCCAWTCRPTNGGWRRRCSATGRVCCCWTRWCACTGWTRTAPAKSLGCSGTCGTCNAGATSRWCWSTTPARGSGRSPAKACAGRRIYTPSATATATSPATWAFLNKKRTPAGAPQPRVASFSRPRPQRRLSVSDLGQYCRAMLAPHRSAKPQRDRDRRLRSPHSRPAHSEAAARGLADRTLPRCLPGPPPHGPTAPGPIPTRWPALPSVADPGLAGTLAQLAAAAAVLRIVALRPCLAAARLLVVVAVAVARLARSHAGAGRADGRNVDG